MKMPPRYSLLAGVLVLAACASPANHYDPLESVNRPIYQFNVAADKVLLKPVAKAYRAVTPQFVQTGVHNFYENIDDVFTIINGALQGKAKQAGSDTLRVLLNTTVGVVGLVDVASHVGLEKHDEDVGQTLGYWGVGSGAYVMLPFMGPSTLRDLSHFPLRFVLSPIGEVEYIPLRNTLYGLSLVDTRAQLLDYDALLDDAFDPYSFVRDSYLQQRYNKVWDGNPPEPLKLSDDEAESEAGPDPLETPATPASAAEAATVEAKPVASDAAAAPAP